MCHILDMIFKENDWEQKQKRKEFLKWKIVIISDENIELYFLKTSNSLKKITTLVLNAF